MRSLEKRLDPVRQPNQPSFLSSGRNKEQSFLNPPAKPVQSKANVIPDSQQAVEQNAQAFTQGNDIHFAPGAYKPGTSEGKELLGHELAHVKQQEEGRAEGTGIRESASLEREADQQAGTAHQDFSISEKRPGTTAGNADRPKQRRVLTRVEERAAIAANRARFGEKAIRIIQAITGTGMDGDFGPLSARAVSDFQTARGLTDNGIIDEPTLDAMLANRVTAAQHIQGIELVMDFHNISMATDTLSVSFNAAASHQVLRFTATFPFFRFDTIPADTTFETGNLRVIQVSAGAFANSATLRDTIRNEMARVPAAGAAPGPTPATLNAGEARNAVAFNNNRFNDARAIRTIQALVGAPVTGTMDLATVQFIASVQAAAGLTTDGMVGDQTTEHFWNQLVASSDFNAAIRLVIDSYNLVDDNNLMQIRFDNDPAIAGSFAATTRNPNGPVDIRITLIGMQLPFAGAVLNIGHEIQHARQHKQGILSPNTREFLAEGFELLSPGIPDDILDPAPGTTHDAFLDDAGRCIDNWDLMPLADQRTFRNRFFTIRREVLRRIDGATAVQRARADVVALRARYVAVVPPR